MLSTRAIGISLSEIHHAGAVDDDRVAAVEGGGIARQVGSDSFEVGRVPGTGYGILGRKVLVHLAELAFARHAGFDVARGNRIGADTVLAELDGHGTDYRSQG